LYHPEFREKFRLVAALVIVGAAASPIAASFGLSVLIWQDLFGIKIHWLVMLMSVIILLAVGSDYNLLLASRFKEEIHAGLKTETIGSMAGTGGVVTAAGLVFAFTIAAMVGSSLQVLGPDGFHDLCRPAARHPSGPLAYAVDRHCAYMLLVVAPSRPPPGRQCCKAARSPRRQHRPAAYAGTNMTTLPLPLLPHRRRT
jgi:hypothetical protein